MARPLTVTDDQILDAAQLVLARRGPGGFTASEVARDVNLSRTAVVLRFTSTEALKASVLDRQLERFRAKLVALAVPHGADGLLAISDFIAALIGGRDHLASFLLRLSSDSGDDQRLAMEMERGRLLRLAIDSALPDAMHDRTAAANAFMAHVTGTLFAWQFVEGADVRAFMRQRTLDWLKLVGLGVGIA
jgi:AcrR family transcriptional regulator